MENTAEVSNGGVIWMKDGVEMGQNVRLTEQCVIYKSKMSFLDVKRCKAKYKKPQSKWLRVTKRFDMKLRPRINFKLKAIFFRLKVA